MKKLMLIALTCSSLTGCFSLGEHIDNGGCPEDYYQGTQKAAELGMWVFLP